MTESLVAIRDRRDQVIARLTECYATDVLEVDELERRLDDAHAARSLAELDALVVDLAPSSDVATALVPSAQALAVDDPQRLVDRRLRVLFGSVERRGPWSVPRTLRLRVWFGSSVLDFREASIGPGLTTIDVEVTFGTLEVFVPPWLAVDVDVSSMFGNVEERHRAPAEVDPNRPFLRIIGAVRFGNLELSTRLPGESNRQARRRERSERKRLADKRGALPPGSGKAM